MTPSALIMMVTRRCSDYSLCQPAMEPLMQRPCDIRVAGGSSSAQLLAQWGRTFTFCSALRVLRLQWCAASSDAVCSSAARRDQQSFSLRRGAGHHYGRPISLRRGAGHRYGRPIMQAPENLRLPRHMHVAPIAAGAVTNTIMSSMSRLCCTVAPLALHAAPAAANSTTQVWIASHSIPATKRFESPAS